MDEWKKTKNMRISRTNTPTLSSVIVSLEKKKKNISPQTTSALNHARSCSLLFTPTPPSSSPSSFLLHPFQSSSCSHLVLSVVLEIRSLSAAGLWWEEGIGVCICVWVWHIWSIRYKVHAELQQVMLGCVFITPPWRDKQGTTFLISWVLNPASTTEEENKLIQIQHLEVA